MKKGANGSVPFIDEQADATKGSNFSVALGNQGGVIPTSTTLNMYQQVFMAEPNYK